MDLFRKGARFFKRAQPRHWILAVILIAGGLLRFSGLGQESLWADEYHSLLNAMQPTWRAVSQHAWLQGVQPPYFWLLHGFIQLVSPSDVALRIPSAVCGVMAIFFLYQLGRLLIATRPGFALLGAALLALSPMHIWYSQEARPYALQVLVEIMALWALAKGWSSMGSSEGRHGNLSQIWLIIAGLLVVLAIEIHNFSIFLWLTFLAIFPLTAWRRRNGDWKALIVPGVILAVGIIHPLFCILDRLGPRRSLQSFLPPSYSLSVVSDVLRAQLLGPHWSPLPLWAQWGGITLGTFFLINGARLLYRECAPPTLAGVLPATGWMMTLAVPTAISFVHPIIFYGQRYLIIALPFSVMLLAGNALGDFQRNRRSLKAGIAFLMGCAFLVCQCAYFPPYYAYRQKHPWDQVGAYLERNAKAEDRIFVAYDWNTGLLARYMHPPRVIEGMASGEGYLRNRGINGEKGKPSRIFLVCYQDLRPWLKTMRLAPPVKNVLFETHQPGQTLWVHELLLP